MPRILTNPKHREEAVFLHGRLYLISPQFIQEVRSHSSDGASWLTLGRFFGLIDNLNNPHALRTVSEGVCNELFFDGERSCASEPSKNT